MVRNVAYAAWPDKLLTCCTCRVEEVETPQLLDAWVKTLDLIEALKPEHIIAGHCTYFPVQQDDPNHVVSTNLTSTLLAPCLIVYTVYETNFFVYNSSGARMDA